MRCNIITDTGNSVGLATDAGLLTSLLRKHGHQVSLIHWAQESSTADVNFYLEKFNPRHLTSAPKHVGIFNLEWFSGGWLQHLPRMTQIWAKSCAALEWFVEQGLDQTIYTGFMSRDPHDPTIRRERRALHLAGRSSAKNTTAVLRAYWDAHVAGVQLPLLTIVSFARIESLPPGVFSQLNGEWGQGTIDHLLNVCRFHLCPSEVEGWGHYITEATACGGAVIATDASPMNEHVLPTFGRLVTPSAVRRTGFADRHDVDPGSLVTALRELDSLSDAELDAMGARAREWCLLRNTDFEAKALAALGRLEHGA